MRETAWHQGRRDGWQWLSTSEAILPWILVAGVAAVGVAAWFTPDGSTPIGIAVRGLGGAVIGFAIFVPLVLIAHILSVTPLKQRDEARDLVEELQLQVAQMKTQPELLLETVSTAADVITGKIVRLSHFAGPNAAIKNKTFIDCYIIGPAVLAGSGAGHLIIDSVFMGMNETNVREWVIATSNQRGAGAIATENLIFRGCLLSGVSLLCPEAQVDEVCASLLQSLKRG